MDNTALTVSGRIYDYRNGRFLITGSNMVNTPKVLYKYYAINNLSMNALTNMYVYATHPMQFTDKNDCSKEIVKIDNIETALKIIENDEIIKQLKEICGCNNDDIIKFADEAYYELIYRKWGILSLCDTFDNVSLWNDIAKDDGFCIAFDYSKWSFYSVPYPISYEKVIPRLRSSKTYFPTALLVQCMVKLEKYNKEKEWRMIINSPKDEDMESFGKYRNLPMTNYHNRHFFYPYESVMCIILGHHFFGNSVRVVSETEYRVDFMQESPITQIIDFLIEVQYDVYWRNIRDFGGYTYSHIFLLHLHNYSYRIIVDNKNKENEFINV